MSKRITKAQSKVIIPLAVMGIYGEGLEDAYEDEELMPAMWSNHLVKKSLLRKELVTVLETENGKEIYLTDKAWDYATKEIEKFDTPHEAFVFYRYTMN